MTITAAHGEKEGAGGYRQINKALHAPVYGEYLKGQFRALPPLPPVEQLSPRVLRVKGLNPGHFTYQGTNTFIVGTGVWRILIDTSGGEPEYATLLASTLAACGIRIKFVLITHWHGDHSGGIPDVVRLYPHLEDHIYKYEAEAGQQELVDGQTFAVEGATVTCVHTPGHSTDHMCFVLQEENAMFTGDNILGVGTSAYEDLALYMSSLEVMAAQECLIGYPGHGSTILDLPAKIGKELTIKRGREKQAIMALKALHRQGRKTVTVAEIVTAIYGDTVDSAIKSRGLEPAVDEIIRKLAGDGKVGFNARRGLKQWYYMN